MNEGVSISRESWCSWCGNFSRHVLHIERAVGRSTYKCTSCEHLTIKCRYCENMARASLSTNQQNDEGDSIPSSRTNQGDLEKTIKESPTQKNSKKPSRWSKLRGELQDKIKKTSGDVSEYFEKNWDNELCAEHDGSIPDFSKAHEKIENLGQFKEIMKPKRKQYYGHLKQAAVVASGAAAIGTGAWVAAPGIAAAMGSLGLLGAAGTGTAIGSLSGAALTSASVAKLGAGGLAVVSAVGAGLGGKAGYGIAHSYLRDVPDYDFFKKRDGVQGCNHEVITVSGFLSENTCNGEDWENGLSGYYSESGLWHLNWESKTLLKLGYAISNGGKDMFTMEFFLKKAGKGSKVLGKTLSKGGAALTAANLISNPWHSAMLNAEKSGLLLAEAISRSEGKTYTLIGHSLGARVVFFALLALATKEKGKYIKDAVLLGSALGVDSEKDWNAITNAVAGNVYNCYTNKDMVLSLMYRTANFGLSEPAGIVEIPHFSEKIKNVDFSTSSNITGHTLWKENIPEVMGILNKEGLRC